MRRNLLKLGVLVAINGYCLKLFLAGELLNYINPRYVTFTGVMNLLSLIVCIAAAIALVGRKLTVIEPSRHWWAGVLLTVPVVLVLSVGWILPPQPLTRSNVASKSLAELVANSNGQRLSFASERPEGDKGIAEWISELSGPVDEASVVSQPVDVLGFVHAGAKYQPNEFVLSRLVIYCCAVDATPVGLGVHEADWRGHLKEGSWVQVHGSFRNFGDAMRPNYILVPSSIEPLGQPGSYLYYKF
ncbi:MAG: hypothetical protein JWN01_664 [Patescibacteria group bacterium]|nr:hypothetical protein [Patescibacteria group bacterium]